MTIIQTLTKKGFTLALEGERLAITPKASLTADLREFIRVNKRQLVSELKTQSGLVSSAFDSARLPENLKSNEKLADFKSDKLHETLNRYIKAGCAFDVSADDFQVIDNKKALKASDREFIEFNSAAILCQLQQSLLMKHLFSHSPEQFEDFAFEIMERESLLTMTAKTQFEIYFEAVKQTTQKWFKELLQNG